MAHKELQTSAHGAKKLRCKALIPLELNHGASHE
jgi:hypothetical protein